MRAAYAVGFTRLSTRFVRLCPPMRSVNRVAQAKIFGDAAKAAVQGRCSPSWVLKTFPTCWKRARLRSFSRKWPISASSPLRVRLQRQRDPPWHSSVGELNYSRIGCSTKTIPTFELNDNIPQDSIIISGVTCRIEALKLSAIYYPRYF